MNKVLEESHIILEDGNEEKIGQIHYYYRTVYRVNHWEWIIFILWSKISSSTLALALIKWSRGTFPFLEGTQLEAKEKLRLRRPWFWSQSNLHHAMGTTQAPRWHLDFWVCKSTTSPLTPWYKRVFIMLGTHIHSQFHLYSAPDSLSQILLFETTDLNHKVDSLGQRWLPLHERVTSNFTK